MKPETREIRAEADIVGVRQLVRNSATAIRLSLVDQTKLVTAASEIARNTLVYGGGGRMSLEAVENGMRRGLRLVFEDQGPGIADLEKALQDGYTTGGGLGLGLSGSKRLVDEFKVESEVGRGTKVSLTKWK